MSESKAAVSPPQWFMSAMKNEGVPNYFDVQGIKLHYLSWTDLVNNNQPDSIANKPVLLFLHGFRSHARWWSVIAPFFAHKYNVYALDWSGMGDSDNRNNYDDATHINELIAFIRYLQAGKVSIVAHSFGGGRALRASVQAPELFEHIIAIDSHMGFADEVPGNDPITRNVVRKYPSLDAGMSRFRLSPAHSAVQPYLYSYIAGHSLKKCSDGQWTWKFDPTLTIQGGFGYDSEKILGKVPCTVDYIYGENSAVMSDAKAKRIFSGLVKANKLVCVPDGCHHVLLSNPVATISTLLALL